MPKSRKETNLSSENQAARELGLSVAREFERVVETFNRVLQYKEKIGQGLEEEIVRTGQQVKSNRDAVDNLKETTQGNNQKLDGIVSKLGEIQSTEKDIVGQYQRLLKGVEGGQMDSSDDNGAAAPAMTAENLIRQKEDFLERMQSGFKKLDEELLSTTRLKDELELARAQIVQSNQDALRSKSGLEEVGHQLLTTLEDNAKELENSIQSERILVDEFTKIIKNVENCVSLTDNIDQVLFSSLDEAETPPQYESASENSANGN